MYVYVGVQMTSKLKDVFAFATLLARRRILLDWKSEHPPKASASMNDLILFLQLQKIKYSSMGSIHKFHERWDALLSHFEKLKTLPEN